MKMRYLSILLCIWIATIGLANSNAFFFKHFDIHTIRDFIKIRYDKDVIFAYSTKGSEKLIQYTYTNTRNVNRQFYLAIQIYDVVPYENIHWKIVPSDKSKNKYPEYMHLVDYDINKDANCTTILFYIDKLPYIDSIYFIEFIYDCNKSLSPAASWQIHYFPDDPVARILLFKEYP